MINAGQITDYGSQPQAASIDFYRNPRKRWTKDEAAAFLSMVDGSRPRWGNLTARRKIWLRDIAAYAGMEVGELTDIVMRDDDFALTPSQGSKLYRANHIRSYVNRRIAQLSASSGTPVPMPPTPDIADQMAARAARSYLDHIVRAHKLDYERRMLLTWAVICGTSYMVSAWDEGAGDVGRIWKSPNTGERLADQSLPRRNGKVKELLEEYESYDDEAEGDHHLRALGPFQVFYADDFTEMRDVPWIGIEELWSPQKVWSRYPKNARDVHFDYEVQAAHQTDWRRLTSLVSMVYRTGRSRSNAHREGVVVRHFWVPPSPLLKEGAYICATNRTILYHGPHNLADTGVTIPVFRCRHTINPGSAYGDSLTIDLISLQEEYNEGINQVFSQRNRVGHPTWIAARDAEVEGERHTFGDMLEFDGRTRYPPQLISPPTLSEAHVATVDRPLDDMARVASQSDVSQGRGGGSNVRSADQTEMLQEADAQVISNPAGELEDCWGDVLQAAVRIAQHRVTNERVIAVHGLTRGVEAAYFTGSDMRGVKNVWIQKGTMQPRSRALQIRRLQDLLSLGAIDPTNPDHRRWIREVYEIGDADRVLIYDEVMRSRARKIIDRFARPKADDRGEPAAWPQPYPFDDAQIMVEELTMFAATDQFEFMLPQQQQAFLAFMQQQQEKVAQEAEIAMQMQAAVGARGSEPRETGRPSAPKQNQRTSSTS